MSDASTDTADAEAAATDELDDDESAGDGKSADAVPGGASGNQGNGSGG